MMARTRLSPLPGTAPAPRGRELFERRSGRMVGAVSAGVEALIVERDEGREPHWAASDAMIDEIRRELRDVAGIILG